MHYGLLLLFLAQLSWAKDAFIYPPDANTFPYDVDQMPRLQLGDTIQLKWASSIDVISIVLRLSSDPVVLTGVAQGTIIGT